MRREGDRRLFQPLAGPDLRDQLEKPPELPQAQAADVPVGPAVEAGDDGELVAKAEAPLPPGGGISATPMASRMTRRIWLLVSRPRTSRPISGARICR